MIGYQVGKDIFFNKHLALYNLMIKGSIVEPENIKFIAFDETYDKINWLVEPTQSFEELMTAHALDLRNRYERIILSWSGGTDSHTIYNIFKKNNIHIDEIIIKTADERLVAHQPKYHANWMRKNHYDSSTIITEYDQYDENLIKLDRPNEEWIWKNSGDIHHSGANTGGEHTLHLVEKNHSGKKYIHIGGYEKPHVFYKDKTWWTCFKDMGLYQIAGTKVNYDYFYLNPLIHLKQSHLLKNFCKILLKQQNLNIEKIQTISDKEIFQPYDSKINYKKWALSLGRDEELTEGISQLQKNNHHRMISIDLLDKNYKDIIHLGDPAFNIRSNNDNKTTSIFSKGLFNLYSEKKFLFFLMKNKWIKSIGKILDLKIIYSKAYNLGP